MKESRDWWFTFLFGALFGYVLRDDITDFFTKSSQGGSNE